MLRDSFYDYPVMKFMLKNSADHYDDHVDLLMGYFTEVRLTKEWPLLGIREEGRLMAVALISPPTPKIAPPELQKVLTELSQAVGEDLIDRMKEYGDKTYAVPEEPHYYLSMLGVLPEIQGKGYGKRLLEENLEMSARDPLSTGVCLKTEVEHNVGIYQHLGFHVTGKEDLDGFTSWCMFCPD